MSSTIELLHYKFTSKLVQLRAIAAAAESAQLLDEVARLESKYKLSVVPVLSKYYSEIGATRASGDENSDVTDQYYRIVTSENFLSQMDDIANRCRRVACDETAYALDAYNRINVVLTLRSVDYRKCECGRIMTLIPEMSELRCDCGKISVICGSIGGIDMGDGTPRSKSTGYDFTRHYKFWNERIQAIEHKTFEQAEIDSLRACMVRDNRAPCDMTIIYVREYLHECNMTEYNDHAALLVVILGGPAPPRFSFQETRDLSITFNKIINLYHKVNPGGSNRPYYPYFIYKMIERKFRNNLEKLRALDYIHLQSEDTLKKNDAYYEQICALSAPEDDLVYIPTNPYER